MTTTLRVPTGWAVLVGRCSSTVDNLRAIGPMLKWIRDAYGVSQQEVADRLGVTREYVSLLENGKRFPSLEVVSSILQYAEESNL